MLRSEIDTRVERTACPDHAARAGACALALDEYAEAFRARSHKKGIALGVTRIGVHAGPAIVGNFGGGRFFGYTAYGDTINVAARLEAANKQLGTRICVSATLADKVQGFRGRPIGDLILRGKTEPLRAFEPLGLNEKGQNDKLKNVAIQNALANSPSLRPKLSPTPSQSCQ